MAIVDFCVQVAGLSAGLSLLVTLIGIPILAALAYVDRWLCNAGIAEALVVTESAVEKHVRQIFAKLGLSGAERTHRRVLAVLAYLRST